MEEGPIGECRFCGHPDKRHRVMDAQVERIAAGEDPSTVADDYGYSVAEMATLWADYLDWCNKALIEAADDDDKEQPLEGP